MSPTYEIMYGNKCIGTVRLTGVDTGMGIALGEFTPTPVYEEVRLVFRLFTKAMLAQEARKPYEDDLNAYYRQRDELHLHVEDADGRLIPSECVHIVDLSLEMGDYEVEIVLSDRADVERLSQEVNARSQRT